MNKTLSEFKAFAMRGNVIDLAVGVIIGGAFGKIVSSLVSDIIMPPIGLIMGGIDFSNLQYVLKEAKGDIPAITLNYGLFIQNIVDFLIIAFSIFMVIKFMSKLQKPKKTAPVKPEPDSKTEELLSKILLELKKNGKTAE